MLAFRKRHCITLRKSERHITLANEERVPRLNKFLVYLYLQPNNTKIWINFDEILDSLAGFMGLGATLEHRGSNNVTIQMDDTHYTLIVLLAVQ